MSGLDDLKTLITRIEDLLERIRIELRRDVVERVFYLENEIIGLRRELRKMSEAVVAFSSGFQESLAEALIKRDKGLTLRSVTAGLETPAVTAKPEERERKQKVRRAKRRGISIKSTKITKEDALKYLSTEANDTELKILKLLYEDPSYGEKGSTEIAKAIGKVREHTARTLKKLCEFGLLMRQEDKVPYSYYLPKEVSEALKAYFKV
ncbi:MAG: hypothetical protein QXT74_00310 [Candidatus Nezhaarchaeales archaeon]